jgi:hypothetical protein
MNQVHMTESGREPGDVFRASVMWLAQPEASLPDGDVKAAITDLILGQNAAHPVASCPRQPGSL